MLTIDANPTIVDSVNAFIDSADSLADLRLVRAVDETVAELCAETKFYLSHATTGRALIAQIKGAPIVSGQMLDPGGEAEASLDEMIDRTEAELATLTAKKGTIDHDNELSDAHCQMLHTSYDDALVALARLIEVAKDMRAALIMHDLAAECRNVPTYATVSQLRNAILN